MRKIQRRSKSTVQLIQKIRKIIISIVYLGVVIGSSFLFADPQLGLVIGIVLFFLLLPLYATARAWLNYLKKKRFHRRLIEAQKTLVWLEQPTIDYESLRIPLLQYIHHFLNLHYEECFEKLADYLEPKLLQSSLKLAELDPEQLSCIEDERFSFDPEISHIAEAYYLLLQDRMLSKEKVKKVIVHLLKANAYADSVQLNDEDQYLKSCLEHS